jgi:hypothetical protein
VILTSIQLSHQRSWPTHKRARSSQNHKERKLRISQQLREMLRHLLRMNDQGDYSINNF